MENLIETRPFTITPIGIIKSHLMQLNECPLQESEGAPEAYIEIVDSYVEGIRDLQNGDKLIVLTWLHLANRDVVKCYKRNDVGSKEFGVFSTRSPDRPNPIGFHIATVVEVVNPKLVKIFPMEALNGTPVIDIKPFN